MLLGHKIGLQLPGEGPQIWTPSTAKEPFSAVGPRPQNWSPCGAKNAVVGRLPYCHTAYFTSKNLSAQTCNDDWAAHSFGAPQNPSEPLVPQTRGAPPRSFRRVVADVLGKVDQPCMQRSIFEAITVQSIRPKYLCQHKFSSHNCLITIVILHPVEVSEIAASSTALAGRQIRALSPGV